MAAVYIPDAIVENILTRLRAKPLLRFRCVSKHWNSLITNPHFMSSRSRRTIFVATKTHRLTIDDNVTFDHTCRDSIVEVRYLCENLKSDHKLSSILGTLNGLVLLQYSDIMILYNPFTRASNKIPYPESYLGRRGDAYGFGYGATTDDLRIVVLYNTYRVYNTSIACEVFNLKTSRWSTCTLQDTYIKRITPKDSVGTFLNGYLYWIIFGENMLIALNLKDMVLSEIHLPFQRTYFRAQLCTINGRLCLINIDKYCFSLWVMNGKGSKTHGRKHIHVKYLWMDILTIRFVL
ncbi:F-box domain-containing protein [Artemisia annua]|uniref:F-box domain-containing protein n=1 Tax=Artemisia annua TaxID=35608 RepID=A0A2U1QKF3_ARTAN|nr:F-box domain-containing protein [Artemisia annua]